MKTEQQVISFAPSSSKPGAWLKMKVIDDKGEQRDAYVKDAALAALVKQAGIYEFNKEKNGQYWEITGVKFLRPLGEATPAQSNGNGGQTQTTAKRSSGSVDANVIVQNRAITAQVCIKAAVELIGKIVEQGGFKSEKGFDVSGASDSATVLATNLMQEAGAFVRGPEPKPAEKTGSYVDGDGRTHEPLEGA